MSDLNSAETEHSHPENGDDNQGKEGLPLWIPFLGLLIAFGAAIFIGIRVFPTLSAIVLPPDPKLPAGNVTAVQHDQKGTGLDEFLYNTSVDGCQVALFYEQLLGHCDYDPSVSCKQGRLQGAMESQSGDGYHVATCYGKTSAGVQRFNWTVYISTGYKQANATIFRVIREVAN